MIPDNTFDVTRGFMINDILVHSGGAYVCIDNTPGRAVWKYRSKSIKEDYGSLNVITQSDWNKQITRKLTTLRINLLNFLHQHMNIDYRSM